MAQNHLDAFLFHQPGSPRPNQVRNTNQQTLKQQRENNSTQVTRKVLRFCICNLNFFKIISVGCKHIFSYVHTNHHKVSATLLQILLHTLSPMHIVFIIPLLPKTTTTIFFLTDRGRLAVIGYSSSSKIHTWFLYLHFTSQQYSQDSSPVTIELK